MILEPSEFMKITHHDVALGSGCSVICLGFGFAAAWVMHHLFLLPHGFQALLLVVTFFKAFILGGIIELWFLRIFWPLQEGSLHLGTDCPSLVWKLHGYLYIFNLGLLINAGLVPVNMRSFAFSLLGTKIGRSVMIGGKILEPSLVAIGDYAMLGEDCLLTAHAVEGDRVDLGRIVVGSNVTVGVKAVILPDVRVGDGAIVAAGAVVKKGSRIPAGEIWGGVPARKIGLVAAQSEAP